jgi:hypothetical protein
MKIAPGALAFLLRCYILPRPNGPDNCDPLHARSPAMADWIERFKTEGLLNTGVSMENLIQGKASIRYLTEKGLDFIKQICGESQKGNTEMSNHEQSKVPIRAGEAFFQDLLRAYQSYRDGASHDMQAAALAYAESQNSEDLAKYQSAKLRNDTWVLALAELTRRSADVRGLVQTEAM